MRRRLFTKTTLLGSCYKGLSTRTYRVCPFCCMLIQRMNVYIHSSRIIFCMPLWHIAALPQHRSTMTAVTQRTQSKEFISVMCILSQILSHMSGGTNPGPPKWSRNLLHVLYRLLPVSNEYWEYWQILCFTGCLCCFLLRAAQRSGWPLPIEPAKARYA